PVATEPVCSRSGDNIPASVIHIEKPATCGRVWIAFSQHAWSEATFKAFANDIKLRDQRMQTFIPKLWVSQGGYRHGMVAT
ncbi:toxin VasX, partial [Acinetobacter baumannii]